MLTALSLLGESLVILPLSAAVAVGLKTCQGWRAAMGWLAPILIAVCVTATDKTALYALHAGGLLPAALSPSGHVALAATFWGGLGCRGGLRLAAASAVPVVGVIVARLGVGVGVGAHTPAEIAAGLAIAIVCLRIGAVPSRWFAHALASVLVAALLIRALLFAWSVSTEEAFMRLGVWLATVVAARL